MKQTLYWYDLETTGTDPGRDRVIQFAGVRTDPDLKVIDEPLCLYCWPGDDVLPSPEAMQVTGIKMSWLRGHGLTETDFIGRVHQEFLTPGSCVTGFNSVRFDDEFMRYTLYRNFIDPYGREWQGNNSRWDVIDLFRMAQALRPEGFVWPRNDKGEPVFKLEAMAKANGIAHESAHEAGSDVLATIALVRKLRAAQPKLYDYLFNLRGKKQVIAQLYPLGKTPLLHVSAMYPAANNCVAVILPLCVQPGNPNGIVCYDLSVDPEALISISAEEVRRRIFTSQKELEVERLHLKTVHVNRCPALAPLATLRGDAATRLGIDLAQTEHHMRRLQQASGLVEKIQDAFSRSEFPPTDDPDLMLYQGAFFSSHDRARMLELRQLSATKLARVGGRFDDERIPEMLFRYRARNHTMSLSAEERGRWDAYRREQWQRDDRASKTLGQLNDLLALPDAKKDCLLDLKQYIEGGMSALGVALPPAPAGDC